MGIALVGRFGFSGETEVGQFGSEVLPGGFNRGLGFQEMGTARRCAGRMVMGMGLGGDRCRRADSNDLQ